MYFNLLRFTNAVLLFCIIILTLTGVYGLFWTMPGLVFDTHRLVGWLLVAAIPWKIAISMRSLRRGLRPDIDRGVMIFVSLILALGTLVVVALGLAWLWRLGPEQAWLRQTLISWHWMLGLALLIPFVIHSWRRWTQPRKVDLVSRRGALRLMAVGAASLAAWVAAESIARRRALPEAARRFTGSRESGSFSGNDFPITHAVGEADHPVDVESWRLDVEGLEGKLTSYTYADLLSHPESGVIATLDCTLGWYSTQAWRGIRLRDLVSLEGSFPGLTGVVFESATGYAKSLPLPEARQVLLATHVGEETINHWHGFPLRAVVPTRRGWYWVKWLSRIRVV